MLRQLHYNEIKQLSEIGDKVYPNFPESYECMLNKYNTYYLGIFGKFINNKLVAYIISHPWNNTFVELNKMIKLPEKPSFYYLHDLAVLPEFRDQKIGSQLIETAIDHGIQKFNKFSLVSVHDTQNFWKKFGFEKKDNISYGKFSGVKMELEV